MTSSDDIQSYENPDFMLRTLHQLAATEFAAHDFDGILLIGEPMDRAREKANSIQIGLRLLAGRGDLVVVERDPLGLPTAFRMKERESRETEL